MGSKGADEVMISGGDNAECSETTVEIKIKTLDSQTYSLRVNKRMPVPALKEQIATVTGVLSEQQRLICRGKVLKDDQLLSAYHVEDGHTLHLVVGQPLPPSSASTTGFMGSESLPDHPVTDPASGTGPTRGNQVAHSVVLGTFNIADQGDGGLPDLNRIISAVLSSIGINNAGGGREEEHGQERVGRTPSVSGISDSTSLQSEQATVRAQSDALHGAFRLPTSVSLGPLQPPVIPDSLTTLSQYLSRMRHEFSSHGGDQSNNIPPAERGLPTPASLADVMLSTRQMLIEQTGECLSQLLRQLENQANITDPLVRMDIQSNAMRSGVLLQNLGALLLELGRTATTLRMGQTPSEAVVNAGPAVFISTSGPNPIMVQPLPFQPGASFGAIPMGTVHRGSGLAAGTLGSGFLPRNIDIQIRTGSSMPTVNVNQGEHTSGGMDPGRISSATNFVHQATLDTSGISSFTGEPGIRVVPIRTVVAAVPTPVIRPAFDSSGSLPIPNSRLEQPFNSGSNNISSGGTQNGQESREELPSRFDQLLRTIFSGEQIRAGDIHFQGSDEGTFFSSLVTQLMPFISQIATTDSNAFSPDTANASEPRVMLDLINQTEEIPDVGTSRRQTDSSPTSPNSKRQKRD